MHWHAALAPLPLSVTVIGTGRRVGEPAARDEDKAFANAGSIGAGYSAGSAIVILTHDHALDFLIAKEALARADLPMSA